MDRARRLVLAPLVLTTLASLGCGGDPPPEPASAREPLVREESPQEGPVLAEPEDSAGSTRAELEDTRVASSEASTAPTVAATTPEPARPLVRLTTLTDVAAEDGAGGQGPASRATAIDLDARRFPARALDPVLHIGALVLRHYEHPRVGVLRFVLAETAAPADGTTMFVQYGDDASSRVELGAFDRRAIVEAQ